MAPKPLQVPDGPAEPCGWVTGLELPPRLTVSQWADQHRIIARGTGPEPGRWRTDRLPLLREVMDSVNDPDVDVVVMMCSSQAAKTETLVNIAGYFIDQDPAPIIFVLPTLEVADSFSTKRFQPTVDETPALRNKIFAQSMRTTSNTIREKSYPGGDIVFAGANSPASLASRPRRIVLCDEIDKYGAAIGKDGDPIDQAFQRTQNFWNAKKVLACSPTIKQLSAIEYWYERSDRRKRLVPCWQCGEYQALEWEVDRDGRKHRCVDWPKGQPERAVYVCQCCGAPWDQKQVHIACQHGIWRATANSDRIAGFHWNTLYTPWVTLAGLAKQWEAAEGKPEKEQTFWNLKLGLPYSPTKEAETTPEALHARRGDFGPASIPAGVLLITVGVDVQPDRFEIQYVGWGVNDTRWVLDYQVYFCDTSDPKVWDVLDVDYLSRAFTHPSGRELQIEAAAIDSGYNTQRAYTFCNAARAAFKPYYAVKGVRGWGRPIWKESAERIKGGGKLYIVGVDDGKTMTYHDVTVTEPSPRVHFAGHLDLAYFKGLLSEVVLIEYQAGLPVRKWDCPRGRRNEPLDTMVYATAARYALSIDYEARAAAMRGDVKPAAGYAALSELFKR